MYRTIRLNVFVGRTKKWCWKAVRSCQIVFPLRTTQREEIMHLIV